MAAALDTMVDQLLTAYSICALVQGTSGISGQGDAPSKQIDTTLSKLAEIVSSRQNYAFFAVLRDLPRAVSELGWIIDNAVARAAKFLSALQPPLSVSDVYKVCVQSGTSAILLSCYGHARTLATPPVPPKKHDALLAALRLAILPRRILPEMFGDSAVDSTEFVQGWSQFGPGDVAGYFDTRLDELDPSSALSSEREHFHKTCADAVRSMADRIQSALNRGETVEFPVWAVGTVSCRGGAAQIGAVSVSGATTEVAAGGTWVVSAAQLGADVQQLRVVPSEGSVLSLVI